MDEATAKQLREPFPAELVGKLPRIWCGACRDARGKVCDQHRKAKCGECGNNITSAHLHLDFVGHADTTDRLLQVDPSWTWEPVAFGPDGLPLLDRNGGLWIRLTVCGVTRYGYGHADGKQGPDAVKEAIGDALRNAAMRFGVALDLWRKEPPPTGEVPTDRPASRPATTSGSHQEVHVGYDARDPAKIRSRAFARWDKLGIKSHDDRIKFCRLAVRRPIDSTNDLSANEWLVVEQAIDEALSRQDQERKTEATA